ncbi:TPA: hypothetical protein I7754_21610, partial [Vibrio vulnificus]|nr:hypothetical protein [Vibrio vulnificus]
MIRLVTSMLLLTSSFVNASADELSPIEGELMQFAKVNCLYQYFQHKNYDLGDIRNISAGIVQISSIEPETFVEVSRLVKNYEPVIKYKHETSTLLSKC